MRACVLLVGDWVGNSCGGLGIRPHRAVPPGGQVPPRGLQGGARSLERAGEVADSPVSLLRF